MTSKENAVSRKLKAVSVELIIKNTTGIALTVSNLKKLNVDERISGITNGDVIDSQEIHIKMWSESTLILPEGIGVEFTLSGPRKTYVTLYLDIPAIGAHTIRYLDASSNMQVTISSWPAENRYEFVLALRD